MATFLEGCRCKGTRPAGIAGHRFTSRPEIVGALLHERHVARFIIAPTGYGKSTVAYEYANIMFRFRETVWINCKSPCFLRDLDAGCLASGLFEVEPSPSLVVCEDVPALDIERADAFNTFINDILAAGCEMIITCTPSANTFSHLQRDATVIRARHLLLSDEELGAAMLGSKMDSADISAIPDAQRIACLHWNDEGEKMLLTGLVGEEVPGDVLLTMIIMFILQNGVLDDLHSFLSQDRAHEICSIMQEDYPSFGIDVRNATFETIDISIDSLAHVFGRRLIDISTYSLHGSRETFLCCLADMMLAHGLRERACAFMGAFAPKGVAASWLARSGRALIESMHPYAFILLHDSIRKGTTGCTDALSIGRALASSELGDEAIALLYARRILRSPSANTFQKATACLLCLLYEDAPTGLATSFAFECMRSKKAPVADSAMPGGLDGAIMLKMLIAFSQGPQELMHAWLEAASESGAQDAPRARAALLFTTLCLLGKNPDSLVTIGATTSEEERSSDALTMDRKKRDTLTWCAKVINETVDDEELAWIAVIAARHLEHAAKIWGCAEAWSLQVDVQTAIARHEMSLSDQRERSQSEKREVKAQQRAREFTKPDAQGMKECPTEDMAMASSIPILRVNLFGGMEVRMGGKLIETHRLSRMKTRTLLALLVVNKGREVARNVLAEALWPESGMEAYRRNFYSIWSQLRHALAIGDDCPYLVRTQTGCSIDARFVTSDVYEYEKICRALLFGTEEGSDWERMYAAVCNEYSGKLMPCETENQTICSLRDHYHAQIVDGLIATSSRLVSEGEARGALWFAREAARRETRREDVYIALMEAQIASDQRSAALETYFACRTFLNEELGIDPSMRLIDLYRSIIETEEQF